MITLVFIIFSMSHTYARGVQPTHQPVKTDPTQPVGLSQFLGVGGLSWIMKVFFNSGSGWVWVITKTNPLNPT